MICVSLKTFPIRTSSPFSKISPSMRKIRVIPVLNMVYNTIPERSLLLVTLSEVSDY